MIKLPDMEKFTHGLWPYAVAAIEAYSAEVQRLNANAQPVSDGWVKCSEQMPPLQTAIIVGKWNGRLWATKWATYIPSHPEANSFGYIMPGGSWEPDFWMIVPAAPELKVSTSSATLLREKLKGTLKRELNPLCDHNWISSEGRTMSGYVCSKCGDYTGPDEVRNG